jgi:uncharacterized protein (DUF433 family)
MEPIMNDIELLERIVVDPQIFGGKPIIRGNRMAVEHVLGMLAAGSSTQELLTAYDWLQAEDIQACLLYAARALGGERYQPRFIEHNA